MQGEASSLAQKELTTEYAKDIDNVKDVKNEMTLVQAPKSLTLVTVAGNLNPVDLLHLRGHFGIPRFEGDSFKGARDK